MTEKEFGGQSSASEGQEAFLNTLWSSSRTRGYSTWISRADKFLKDINDLHESFRKVISFSSSPKQFSLSLAFQDRLLSTYNRLQVDAHFRRRKNLEKIHKDLILFATEDCYSRLVEIFGEYNQWIKQRSNMISEFERIQRSYEKQCDDIRNHVDMIDDLRKVVHQNIRHLGGSTTIALPLEQNPSSIMTLTTSSVEPMSQRNSTNENNSNENSSQIFMTKIRGTTKKTIEQAEDGLRQLQGVIQQLQQKK